MKMLEKCKHYFEGEKNIPAINQFCKYDCYCFPCNKDLTVYAIKCLQICAIK